jgi:hypothetical protein
MVSPWGDEPMVVRGSVLKVATNWELANSTSTMASVADTLDPEACRSVLPVHRTN